MERLISTNKEEKIKEAYGDKYEELKQHIDSDGWFNPVSKWKNLSDYFTDKQIYRKSYFQRPKSLQGIENNNGWVKIESEDDLPSETECYHVFSKENEYLIGTFHTENKGMIEYWLQNFTHYQPITKPEPPLY